MCFSLPFGAGLQLFLFHFVSGGLEFQRHQITKFKSPTRIVSFGVCFGHSCESNTHNDQCNRDNFKCYLPMRGQQQIAVPCCKSAKIQTVFVSFGQPRLNFSKSSQRANAWLKQDPRRTDDVHKRGRANEVKQNAQKV